MFRVTSRCSSAAAALLAVFVLMASAEVRAQQKAATEEPAVDLQWAVKIPMRDGVKLNATIFSAHGEKAPLPIIFTFTP